MGVVNSGQTWKGKVHSEILAWEEMGHSRNYGRNVIKIEKYL